MRIRLYNYAAVSDVADQVEFCWFSVGDGRLRGVHSVCQITRARRPGYSGQLRTCWTIETSSTWARNVCNLLSTSLFTPRFGWHPATPLWSDSASRPHINAHSYNIIHELLYILRVEVFFRIAAPTAWNPWSANSANLLCLHQVIVAGGGIMFSMCPSVRSSVRLLSGIKGQGQTIDLKAWRRHNSRPPWVE